MIGARRDAVVTLEKQLVQALHDRRWMSLADSAEILRMPVAALWDPVIERPHRGSLRHAERIYAIKVHRHELSPEGILIAAPNVADDLCPRCRNDEPYTPSPWALWDSPHCYDDVATAQRAVTEYVRMHDGWHHSETIARAWHIPVSANLVRGTDNKTLGTFLRTLKNNAAFLFHRHLRIVGEYERTETWVTRQSSTTSPICPDCERNDSQANCPRCGARIASGEDLIDRIQGFHGSKELTVWHLDPPGCTACVPTGW